MAKIYIADIQPNQEVVTDFVVTEKQLRTARNGSVFLTLKLVDKTGEVTGRMWDRAEETAAAIPGRCIVRVRGRSELFRDELQLQVSDVRPLGPGEADPSDFLPVCPIATEELFGRLKKLLAGIERAPLSRLAGLLLADRELMDRFKIAPAAKAMHHAYLGGLLEHTLSVAELISTLCLKYTDLDRDLLILGAVFHDIGKVREFDYEIAIDYSDEGRLVGHMVIGAQMLEEKVRAVKGFPETDAMLLKHLILSHHGEIALGAVRLPMTREAFMLHFADDLDAKMNGLTRVMESAGENDVWTPYQNIYGRFFYKGAPPAPESPADDDTEEERGKQLSLWPTAKRPGA